jgi:transcription antitermination factor NusA-like protein
LSPAKIISIETDKEKGKAKVIVSEDQLSLAIGKGGQNARLAAKLTGWKIDIVQLNENGNLRRQKAENIKNESGRQERKAATEKIRKTSKIKNNNSK